MPNTITITITLTSNTKMNSTPALASTQAQYPVDPASIAAAITAAAPYPAVTKQVARRIRFSRSPPTRTPNNSNSNKTQDDDNSKNKHEDESGDDGIFTQIVYTAFSDKILLTISQNGRLGHWVSSCLSSTCSSEEKQIDGFLVCFCLLFLSHLVYFLSVLLNLAKSHLIQLY